LPLCTASFQQSFDIEDAVVEDVRLKQLIDYREQLDILKQHPWLYFTKQYDARKFEYPDKFFGIVGVDKEQVIEQDDNKYEDLIERHLSVAHTLHKVPGGIQPRVQDIRSTVEDEVDALVMPEKPGVDILLKQMAVGSKMPVPLFDTTLSTFAPGYSTTVHTETVDVSAVTENVVRLYTVLSFSDGRLSEPSTVYTVVIRDV